MPTADRFYYRAHEEGVNDELRGGVLTQAASPSHDRYHFSANPIGVQVACQGGYDNHAQMSAFGIEALRFSLELL